METLAKGANRGSVSTGFDIENSLKTEADNSEYLSRVIGSGGNRKTWTFSAWVKRSELVTSDGGTTIFAVNVSGNEGCLLRWSRENSNYYDGIQVDIGAGGTNSRSYTSSVYRDTSAWYHIVLAVDTTQSTATDRFKLYVNGSLITSYASRNNPAQNFDTSNNQAANSCTQHIGAYTSQGTVYGKHSGYFAEVNHIDGTAYAASDFGEFDEDSGIWKPKEFTGTYSTNGFYLDFADAADLGDDESGNVNDFTENNIAAADQATDTPTNNFCTWNPLHYTTKYTITEGATNQVSSVDGWGASVGSIGVTSGKWYFETQCSNTSGYALLGVIDEDSIIAIYVNGDAHAGDAPYGITYYGNNGSIITNGSAIGGLSFPSWTTETIGCALDLDNDKIYFSKSGTYGNSGDPTSGATGTGAVALPTGGSGTWFISTSTLYAANPIKTNQGGYTTNTIASAASDANGYGTFEHAPPTGYYALCTKNLAEFG